MFWKQTDRRIVRGCLTVLHRCAGTHNQKSKINQSLIILKQTLIWGAKEQFKEKKEEL
jgi:hypothetical protein